jgi:hypothetical protein
MAIVAARDPLVETGEPNLRAKSRRSCFRSPVHATRSGLADIDTLPIGPVRCCAGPACTAAQRRRYTWPRGPMSLMETTRAWSSTVKMIR